MPKLIFKDKLPSEVEIPLELISGNIARIEFATEALGSHQWTWAVWGNPELVGQLVHR